MNYVKKWMAHNQGLVSGLVLCVILAIAAFGCKITTESPFDPEQRVTRAELEIEAQAYAQKLELAYKDLQRKEQIVKTITEAGLVYAQSGGVNPLGVATTMLSILGLGAVVDNRRKDAVIKSKSNALESIQTKVEVADG